MNVQQWQYEFGQQINQLNEPLRLYSDDILYWLNKGQEHFVITRYNGYNVYGKAFEQSQQLIDDLKPLVTKDFLINTKQATENSAINDIKADFGEFPKNLLYLLSQRSQIFYNHPEIEHDVIDGKRQAIGPYQTYLVSNRYSQTDDIYKLLSDPFNTTKPKSPITDISTQGVTIYTDKTFVVNNLIINYLRRPKVLSLDVNDDNSTTESEMPEHTHKEIIQLSADLFLHNTRQLKQRLQRETPTADQTQTSVEENE